MEPKRPDEPQELVHGAAEGAPPAHAQPAGEATDPAPADTGDTVGEIRAAERSAQRAAAVAVAEGFHPLRVRPYVTEPDGRSPDTTEMTALPPAPAAGHAQDGPSGTDLGLFPALYSGVEYAEEPADPDGRHAADEAAAAAVRGRHRRRRRGIVIAAATMAASALAAGAVAVTGQVMADEQGSSDMALPDQAGTMPEVTLPSDAAPGLATTAAPVTRSVPPPISAPSASPSPTLSRPPATSTPPSAAAVTTPPVTRVSAPSVPLPTGTPTTGVSSPPAQSFAPATTEPVLQMGDTGPAVADLQRRLSEAWLYFGPVDGVFDRHVKMAVETFQLWYQVSDATDGSRNGVYGPNTRTALERHTS